MKKTFDSVAFMRKRRKELSRAYEGLSRQQIEEKLQQAIKNNPLWKQQGGKPLSASNKSKH